ncbi:MAG TPA: cysteine desulfurase-like protein [Caulobacteraceae bacterium]|nr:cysteine desulfurase-like protein [Caulobacteraceae bacterium]
MARDHERTKSRPDGAPLDVAAVRTQFPALEVSDNGVPRVHLDNPAGTQVPQRVIERMTDYLARTNANRGGLFSTSRQSDAVIGAARAAVADFFGAGSAEEIVFGANMTSLAYLIARTLAPRIGPGDEVLVTRMDHDGNVSPWKQMAESRGAALTWLDFDPNTYRYDYPCLERVIGPRTRFAAVNYASNITGTINDVGEIARRVRAAGGLTFVDAVQFAPHGDIDVGALGCDFLAASAYKFYGPHAGVLWGRRELLEDLRPPKLRASADAVPERYEIGCQSHEAIAGILGAIEYYAELGAEGAARGSSTPDKIRLAKGRMRAHEEALAGRLIAGLQSLRGVRIHGLTGANEMSERVSTVSVSVPGRAPQTLAKALGARNIFVWSGHNYALELIDRLGLAEAGGVLRFGPVHYNTFAEIDLALGALEDALK